MNTQNPDQPQNAGPSPNHPSTNGADPGSSAMINLTAPPSPGKKWGSEKEAVAYSGLSRTFIRARIKDGDIVARKAGRRKLIDWPHFLTWLENLPLVPRPRVVSHRVV